MEPGLIALIPFIVVPILLASGRAGALAAGAAGLIAVVFALLALNSPDRETLVILGHESLAGLWLAAQAVAFLLGGLFFYRCVRAGEPELFVVSEGAAAGGQFDRRRLFAAAFLIGPFAESATGFGVGQIIALPLILSAGVRGLSALSFSLFSQIFVAWGALGVGSIVGADLAGVPFPALAIGSAWLQAPVLFGHLAMFWLLLVRLDQRPTAVEALDDVLWTALLAAALIAANVYVAPELGGLVATGGLLVLRSIRDEPALVRRGPEVLRSAWPYLALTLLLVATRTVPQFRAMLLEFAPLRPLSDGAAVAPLYHPASWLMATGLAALLVAGRLRRLGPVLGEVTRSGWKPTLVVIVYVVFAQLAAGGGLAALLAQEAERLLGNAAILLAPLLGGLSGFLTGSNTASNGMMMPVQTELARSAGVDLIWAAALQNIAGSTMTLLSPVRIATACALLGLVGQDRLVYSRVWPFGALALIILMLCWLVLL